MATKPKKDPADELLPHTPGVIIVDNHWPEHRHVALRYGCPGNGGDVNPEWESRNLQRVDLPFPMETAWLEPDPHTKELEPRVVKTVRVHREVAASLGRVLTAILHDIYGGDLKSLRADKMHLFGGLYTYRPSTRTGELSMHGYAVAIDFGAEEIPEEVVAAFESEGWTWGGEDEPGHFEATQGK